MNTTKLQLSTENGQGFASSGADLYKFDLSESSLGFGHLLFTVPGNGSSIRGIAGNVAGRVLYVTDNFGRIHVVDMERSAANFAPQILPLNLRKPSLLSFDWLNLRLFVLEESSWEIKCCVIGSGLSSCSVVVEGFTRTTAPEKLVVDPFNGYLFWTSKDAEGSDDTVVRRVDLIVVEEHTKINAKKAEEIFRSRHIQTFAVDYAQFRLYLLDPSTNSIHAINIDCK